MEPRDPIPRLPDPKDMVLKRIHIPQGFSVYEEERWDNMAAAMAWSDRDRWLKNFKTWGRIGGFEATFETDMLGDLIQSSAAIFRSEEGADAAFRAMRVGLEDSLRRRYSAQDRKIIVLEELVRPKTDHESFALHMKADLPPIVVPQVMRHW